MAPPSHVALQKKGLEKFKRVDSSRLLIVFWIMIDDHEHLTIEASVTYTTDALLHCILLTSHYDKIVTWWGSR